MVFGRLLPDVLLITGCDIYINSEDDKVELESEGHRTTKAEFPPELVLYMPFERDTITDEEVEDITSYGNNGIIINDPEIVKGYIGDALDFTNDSIEVRISESLSRTIGGRQGKLRKRDRGSLLPSFILSEKVQKLACWSGKDICFWGEDSREKTYKAG